MVRKKSVKIENASIHVQQVLSMREKEVLQLAADGYSNKQIADLLVISCNTVDTHNRSVVFKLSAKNMKHAVAIGIRKGMVK